MKTFKFILLLTFILSVFYINGQSVVFRENFEAPSLADSVISSPLNAWAISSKLSASGFKSDSCQVVYQDTAHLTTNSFSTIGMQYVILNFDHICKIEFFDAAFIEISTDNGATWTSLTSGHYLGGGQFGAIGNKFNATSYTDWLPVNNNAVPTNQWWKNETFDISSIAANYSQVKIRFALADINSSGAAGNYGWLIDNIKITAAPDELVPPAVSLVAPYPHDSAFSLGPFIVTASISDNSGTKSAKLIYKVNNGQLDTVPMTFNYGNIFSASIDTIPAFVVGDTICYFVWAMDSSLSQNVNTAPASSCQQFIIYTSQPFPGCTSSISSYPFFESFDQNFSVGSGTPSSPGVLATGWSRDPSTTSSFMWLVYSGSTPTGSTGPSSDYSTGAGNYLYTESSYGSVGAVANLLTPCLNLNTINVPVLEFYYHMWGSSQGELHVDIWYGNSWQLDIISPIIGDQGNQWKKLSVNLSAYKSNSTKIRIRAVKGSSIYSDIAIDDLKIWQPPANDAGMVSIDRPVSPANTGIQPIKASFTNFGSATLNKLTINWQINGVLKTPYIWNGVLAPGVTADSIQIGSHNFISGPSNIKIWSSLPNDSADGFHFNDTVQTSIIACTSPLRGVYSIGGATADFINFDMAIYALENCGIDSAIVFKVNAGNYNEQLDIDSIPGASAQNTILFVSATGDSLSTIISFSPSSSLSPFIIRLKGASFISFKNMTITTTSPSYGRLFTFESNASNINVENCILQMPSVYSSYFSAAYATTSKSEHISFINNDISNGYYSIYFSGMSSTQKSKGNRFIGNKLTGFKYYGIYLTYQDSFDISKNYLQNDSTSSSAYPVYAYYADGGFKITKNTVISKGTSSIYGLRVYYGTSTQANPGLVANNFVTIYGSSTYPYGLYIYNCNYIDVLHNSIVIEVDSAPNGRVFYQSQGTFNRVKNNIFINNSLGSVYYIGTPAAIVESDYNNLYANSNNFGYWTNNINDLAALKAISGKEIHSLSLLPPFKSLYNLHLNYSVLSNSGSFTSKVIDDIDGELRSVTSPSMGADEQPPIPIDAGVLQVLSPAASVAEAATVHPAILIKNFGTDTLFNLSVKMTLNGLPLDTQYYSAILPPFVIDTLYFDSFLVDPGHNNICFTTSLIADTNLFNNQLCKYFYGVPKVDMGVVSMISPDSGNCFSTNQELKVIVKNYGSLAINFAQLPVTIYTDIDGPIPLTIPNKVLNSGVLQPGASQQVIITNALDMNNTGDYTFNIWTVVSTDGDRTNDSMKTKKIYAFATVTNYPYSQDFENFITSANTADPGKLDEGWAQNITGVDYKWYVGKGSTYTNSTGPSSDHSLGTASGKYVYAEGFGYYAGQANLVSPCIDFTGMQNPTLRYWYHMYGSSIHSLRIDVFADGLWYYSVGHKIGPQQQNTNDPWKQDIVDLSAFAGKIIKVRFRAIKAVGYEADIAVDDISIFEPVQTDAGVSHTFQKPNTNFASEGIQIPIQVKIENYGLDTLKSLLIGYIAGSNAPVYEQWTGTIHPYSSQLYEFNKKYTVVSGETKICAFTDLAGDMNIGNDTGCISFIGVSVFPVPYTDDFEGVNYFVSTGGMKQWQRGLPNKTVFNSTHSGQNAWVTSLNDNYLNNSSDYLYTPFFNLSTFANTYLRFYHKFHTQSGYDGASIEITTDGGNTFSLLGYISDPISVNWYNTNLGGSHSWSGIDTAWKQSTYSLAGIASSQPVQFRFKLFSDNSINSFEGWLIDDFEISPNKIAQDAGIDKIISPNDYTIPGNNITVTVQIKNHGINTLTQIPVNYRINNGMAITQNWMGTLLPGATTLFTFTSTYTATNSYKLEVWTSLSGDTYWFNDSLKISMSKDIGVSSIINPKPTEIWKDSASVTVQLRNYGNDTIKSSDLSYDINGGNAVTETWSGVLPPEGIAYYTFNQKWLVNYGVVNFCAKTLLSGDVDGTNDKKCQYVSGVMGFGNGNDEQNFTLIQNQPNPFSDRSMIIISTQMAGNAEIKLTDVSGRVVKLDQIKLKLGENKLEIDAQNLLSGIYFYEVSFNKTKQVIKLVVVK